MKHSKLFLSLACISLLSACSLEKNCTEETCGIGAAPAVATPQPEAAVGNQIRGTVAKPYVQPMRDVIKVPAQVDPTNTYYRPSHDTIVEIIPGRVQPIQYGD